MGTPAYPSPERIAEAPADGRSDLYSLAAVFFSMVDGQPPFGRDPDVAVAGHTSKPLRHSPHLPGPVAEVVRRAMSKQPEHRFATARDMAGALWVALEQARVPAASVLRATRAPAESVEDRSEVKDVVLVADPLGGALSLELEEPETGPVVEAAPPGRGSPSEGMVQVGGHSVVEGGTTADVAAFWLDRFPVTNEDFAQFVAVARELPPAWWNGSVPPTDRLDHPVVGVSLDQARRYAQWAGKRLPTTLEWLAAARGAAGRVFPRGSACDGGGYHFVMGGSFKHACPLPHRTPRTAVHASSEYL